MALPVVSSSASHSVPVSTPERAGAQQELAALGRQVVQHVAGQVGADQPRPAAELVDRALPFRRLTGPRWPGGTAAGRPPSRRCAGSARPPTPATAARS